MEKRERQPPPKHPPRHSENSHVVKLLHRWFFVSVKLIYFTAQKEQYMNVR